jgi:hypothetical protein
MPSDETRRLLRMFGMAVTTLEDAVHTKASADDIRLAEREAHTLLREVTALLDRLRDQASRFEA